MIGSMNSTPLRATSRKLPDAATIEARAAETPAGAPDAPSEGLSLSKKAILAGATLATAGVGMAMAGPAHAGGYRYGGYGHRHHHHRRGSDVGGFIAGAIIGGIISGAIANSQQGQVYYPPSHPQYPSGNTTNHAYYDNYGQLICTNTYSGNWYASPDNLSCPY